MLKTEIEDALIGGILEIAKGAAESDLAGMDLSVFFSRTLDYIKSHWDENYAFLVAQPSLTYVTKWKEAIKYHFTLRFPKKMSAPNSGLIMEVVASGVIGAYTYWLQHPDEMDTQKLAGISVQLLCAVDQII
jgi:hypothetical protein